MAVTLIQQQSRHSSGVEVFVQTADAELTQQAYGHLAALAIGVSSSAERQPNPFQEKFVARRQLQDHGTYDRGVALFTEENYRRASERLYSVAVEQALYSEDERRTFEIAEDMNLLDSFISDAEYGLMTHEGIAADERFEAEKFPLKPLSDYEKQLVQQDPRLKRRALQYEVSGRVAADPAMRLEDAAHESLGYVSTSDNRYVPVVTILSDAYLKDRAINIALAESDIS